jgi:hypothetical protein
MIVRHAHGLRCRRDSRLRLDDDDKDFDDDEAARMPPLPPGACRECRDVPRDAEKGASGDEEAWRRWMEES